MRDDVLTEIAALLPLRPDHPSVRRYVEGQRLYLRTCDLRST